MLLEQTSEVERLQAELDKTRAELNDRAEDPNLWNDPEAAQKVMRERTDLEDQISSASCSTSPGPG